MAELNAILDFPGTFPGSFDWQGLHG